LSVPARWKLSGRANDQVLRLEQRVHGDHGDEVVAGIGEWRR